MSMFDTFDRTGVAEFLFPREVVFKAVEHAVVEVKGMTIQDSSPTGGFLNIKTGATAMSWGENVKVSVLSSGPWSAQVQIASAGKTILGSATTHGKNQKNVAALIRTTGSILDRFGAKWVEDLGLAKPQQSPSTGGASPSKADELKKLADLHTQGILTDAEFATEKTRLLNS